MFSLRHSSNLREVWKQVCETNVWWGPGSSFCALTTGWSKNRALGHHPSNSVMPLSTPGTICVQWTANTGNTRYGLKLISAIQACIQMSTFQEIRAVLQTMCCFMAECVIDGWPASLTAWVRGESRVTGGAVSTTQIIVHMWLAGRLHCLW